jgi:acetyltransferase-like isoleucine patch superfamily enzyme
MSTPPASPEAEIPPLAARAELRALLRGDLRQFPTLIAKARQALAARRQLRRCTSVGRHVRVLGRVRVENEGAIIVGERALFRATLMPSELIAYRGARLEIGARTFINYGCSLVAAASVRIGADCLIGPLCNVMDTDFHDLRRRAEPSAPRMVEIGDNVWLGTRVIVLPGVTIGAGAVIGAGSVVTQDIPPNTIAAGNPARVLRTL